METNTLAHMAMPKQPGASEALRLLMQIDPEVDLENYEKAIWAFVIFATDEGWSRDRISAHMPRDYSIEWN